LPESIAAHAKTSSKSLVCATNGNAGVKVVGVLSTVVGIVIAGMEAPENAKKKRAATPA
jgi:hypothetical protein